MADRSWLLPGSLDPEPPGRRSVRDWLVDILCVLESVAIGLFVLDSETSRVSMSDQRFLLDLVVAVPLLVALFWRRRFPVVLAMVTAAAGTFSYLSAGVGLIALFTVAVHRRFAVVLAVTGFTVLTFAPYVWLTPDPTDTIWMYLPWSLLMVAVVVGWGMVIRARRQLLISLRDRAHRAETEQELRIEQARYLERARIAREMHDVLAHRISLVTLHAGALQFHPGAPEEEVARAAGVIRDNAHLALDDLRAVIGVLRANGADGADGALALERPQPTLADLPALIDESRAAGMRIAGDLLPDLGAVPAGVGRTAYRVVQEGLTNARKHAPGTTVEVRVGGRAGDGLNLEIVNRPAVGPQRRAPGTGTGLVGVAERVGLAGGTISHGPTVTGDFRLQAWLPWPS